MDGGCLTTPSSQYERAKLLRWYGMNKENRYKNIGNRCEPDIPEAGWKYHMNDVSAAIGIVQMDYVEGILAAHRANSAYYDCELNGVDGVTLLERDSAYSSSCWIYTLKVEKREDFIRAMKDRGVATSGVHERNDNHSCLSQFKTELPQLDTFSHKIVCIPVHKDVSPEDRAYIVDAIRGGW